MCSSFSKVYETHCHVLSFDLRFDTFKRYIFRVQHLGAIIKGTKPKVQKVKAVFCEKPLVLHTPHPSL